MPTSPRFLMIGAVVAVVLLAIGLRYQSVAPSSRVPSSTPQAPASSTVPAFMSAQFENGDPLKSLGPEWTFVRQSDLSSKDATSLKGVVPQRESVVKLVGKDAGLIITELAISDKKLLETSFAQKDIVKTTVAGRAGFIIPTADIQGGTGFAIAGETTVLLLQDVQSALWPTAPAPEILSYIANVNVR